MRILIADDEPLMSDSLRHLLDAMGHEVIVANSPVKALDYMRREPLDLVLLDWLMPGGGGQTVVRALAAGEVPPTSVVLMTGGPNESLPPSTSHLPVLYKPFRLRDLQAILSALSTARPAPAC